MEQLTVEYHQLLGKVRRVIRLATVKAILGWDMDTYMPPGAIEQRSDQFELLQGLIHEWETDPSIGVLLACINRPPQVSRLNAFQQRNVYLIQRHYDRQTKLPPALVKALAKHKVLTNQIWKQAKARKDFGLFRPALEKIVDLTLQKANALDRAKDPLDVLLDLYEPGASSHIIAPLFDTLKTGVMSLIKKYAREQAPKNFPFLHHPVPIEVQKQLGQKVCSFAGLDFNYARVDETEHPFSSGYFEDIRIATHYHEGRFTSGLFALLHECGHALYEFNLPKEWRWTPIGTTISLGVHESQSRFLENVVGRSPAFWTFFYPQVQKAIGAPLENVQVREFVQAVNDVKPSMIRIDADEVTYSLHIILRFEIEQMLLQGKVNVAELPQVWNEKVDKYLGLVVKNDAEGVLQDVHWAGGSFGYFPTYVLGNLYSGMFLKSMEKEVPDLWGEIAKGNLAPARTWLISHVYSPGNILDPFDFVRHVTGEEVTVEPFLRYLEKKFGELN